MMPLSSRSPFILTCAIAGAGLISAIASGRYFITNFLSLLAGKQMRVGAVSETSC
ncbi:hypothetical protein [Tychonema sp. LEGE 07203]|uniref:hypothetical protein n=1 Tax=Tychonema sp. LEGE 07203 TaxID=1828671 RepID=UPI00188201A9|nr:hypothetical protein [Tychonema sp. LEGE 07203]MBE9095582.1 hypothetical protein [Tychonema sp. LEGE 07203]